MFNPFDEKPITLSDTMMDWKECILSLMTKHIRPIYQSAGHPHERN